ncbi:hypothetical protein [Synechococcus sp. UW140]|uniref:hypothetical protein n=1 Tax=Synechococcus sp. UW140 TaxID=368503 RepID=UPI000E0F60E8|nr:hypothetical protein [Synechococcus sp. UW140]
MNFTYSERKTFFNDQSVLVPSEHEISFDAYLIDSDFLVRPNRYGEFIAQYQPLDMGAMHMLYEAGERALSEVLMSMGSDSMKEPRPNYEKRDGSLFTSQLFAPKLNIDPDDTDGPFFQPSPQVSVRANFHDREDGMIYLHAQYIDFYEKTPLPDLGRPERECDIDF